MNSRTQSRIWKRSVRLLVIVGMLVSAVGCAGSRFAPFPGPEHPCPTLEDDDWLLDNVNLKEGDLVDFNTNLERLVRYREAGAYCRVADRRLN